MATTTQQDYSVPKVSQSDLKDPTLFRLNSILSTIFGILSTSQSKGTTVVQQPVAAATILNQGTGSTTPAPPGPSLAQIAYET